MDILAYKKKIRKELKSVIAGLHNQRRFEAAQALVSSLHLLCSYFPSVLSFSSFQHEIEMHSLNAKLAQEGRLLLPRVENNEITLYFVSDCKGQLIKSAKGMLEPNPVLCNRARSEEVELVFVPGLGFDKQRMRIGYGKGMYDRLLPKIGGKKIGIGFKEQECDLLFTEAHDIFLHEIMLF